MSLAPQPTCIKGKQRQNPIGEGSGCRETRSHIAAIIMHYTLQVGSASGRGDRLGGGLVPRLLLSTRVGSLGLTRVFVKGVA